MHHAVSAQDHLRSTAQRHLDIKCQIKDGTCWPVPVFKSLFRANEEVAGTPLWQALVSCSSQHHKPAPAQGSRSVVPRHVFRVILSAGIQLHLLKHAGLCLPGLLWQGCLHSCCTCNIPSEEMCTEGPAPACSVYPGWTCYSCYVLSLRQPASHWMLGAKSCLKASGRRLICPSLAVVQQPQTEASFPCCW